MTPYFSYEAQSAFGAQSPSAIGVLVTFPAAHEWYVVMDKKLANPLFETDSLDEANKMAERYSAISDLAFLAKALSDTTAVRYVETSLDCSVSHDGLDLIPAAMIRSAASFKLDDAFHRAAEGNEQWNSWVEQRDEVLAHRPRSLVFSFDQKSEVQYEEGPELETKRVYFMAELDWGITDLKGATLKALDGDFVINGQPLSRFLHEIEISPENELWVHDDDEVADWIGVTQRMPLFTQFHNPELKSRIYAYEGGPVLESIAQTRPWMVEKDGEGNPIPLRIVKALDHQVVSEAGLKDDQHFIAAIFLMDQLTIAARAEIIKEQQSQGIHLGQVTQRGQFVKVAEFESGVVLEAMFDRATPNLIGTRDWLNYRLWVEGELVLDVHPDNAIQYKERTVSISPVGGPLDPSAFSMSSDQIGQLLYTALAEADMEEGESELPRRVAMFLKSPMCEELQGDAQAIEMDEAYIADGKLVRRVETEEEALPAPSN